MKKIENFIVVDSAYGKFIVNRYCDFQAEALVKTGLTHIESELNVVRSVLSTLPKDCVVVDGGANIGFVSVPIADEIKPKGGKVYAFEPQRMLFNALCGTIALNDIDNLFLTRQALGSEAGTAFVPAIDYGRRMDFGTVELNTQAGEPVPVVTIDSLGLPRVDFIKLDVEGYEIAALKGARATLERDTPWCWVEYWKVSKEAVIKCFDGLDYEFHVADSLNMLCIPKNKAANLSIKMRN